MGGSSKYIHLDVLRGIAILGVVLSHLGHYWTNVVSVPLVVPLVGVDLLNLFPYGSYGVSLFFLLSGYLLFGTEGSRAKRGDYSMRGYATRRVLRIVPAYYLSILVVVLLWPTDPSAWNVITHGLFLHTLVPGTLGTLDGVYWSLGPEAVFYLLLPLVVLKLAGLRARLGLFLALLALAVATRVYLASEYPGGVEIGEPGFEDAWFLLCLPTSHLYLFIAGTLAGDFERAVPPGLRRPLAGALFLGSVSFFALYPFLGPEVWSTRESPWELLVNLGVFALFFSVLLSVRAEPGPFSGGRFGGMAVAVLAFVGAISYSAFLFHITVLRISSANFMAAFFRAHSLAWGPGEAWLIFAAYLALMLALIGAVSFVIYRCVELPFLRAKPR